MCMGLDCRALRKLNISDLAAWKLKLHVVSQDACLLLAVQ